ncbi:hypothetical protein [Nonomuraea sp. NPDC048916]
MLFAVLVVLGSLSVGGAVVFVTPTPAPAAEPHAPCPGTESPG